MITRRTLLAALGLSGLLPAIPAVASIPPEPLKHCGVIRWERVPNAVLYIVEIKNQSTGLLLTYNAGDSGKNILRFAIADPLHVFRVSVKAIGFDCQKIRTPNYTVDLDEFGHPDFAV